jgi:putative tryptophan/tyrosine transport system substrate-binding protein
MHRGHELCLSHADEMGGVESAVRDTRRLLGIALATCVAILTAAGLADTQQAPRLYRIGVLTEGLAATHPTVEGLRAGLRELGLEESRDVTFDIRFTRGNPEATPAAAAALVNAGVDLLFTSNENATHAAKAATGKLPIVFTLVGDPVAAGIVKQLARPGGNLTGISNLAAELMPKRLEILKSLAPAVRRVWFIHYGGDLTAIAALVRALEVAPSLGLDLVPRGVIEIEQLTKILRELRPGDALLAPDKDALDIPAAILQTSLVSRVPAVFPSSLWVGDGGLVSYGPDYYAQGLQAARLVAKILKGARPEDLPVEGADKIDLGVNLKTATLLGLTVPHKILLRAETIRR